MATIVNTTAAQISISTPHTWGEPEPLTDRRKMVKKGTMYNFIPSLLTTVEDDDFELLKKHKFMQRCLDDGSLEVGAIAEKIAKKAKKKMKDQIEKDEKRSKEEEG